MNENSPPIEGELEPRVDLGTMLQISRAEIDGQIATAKAYPRKVSGFIKEARELACLDEETAESCIYSLPRGKNQDGSKKFITGPSARFAEIICHSWGNNRAGGRVTEVGKETITAQGVFHDLEKNTQITKEISRGILDSYGKRYKADMVNVTGNAAISIALRNAILAGIPQALWMPVYEAARQAAVGDITTLVVRRTAALAWFAKVGVSPEAVFSKIGIEGVEDIGIEQLETLVGIKTALRRGDYSPERAFAEEKAEASAGAASVAQAVQASRKGKPEKDAPLATLPEVLKGLHLAENAEQLDEAANKIGLLPKADQEQAKVLHDARVIELMP